jgi:hypothetical protein
MLSKELDIWASSPVVADGPTLPDGTDTLEDRSNGEGAKLGA